MRKYNIPTTISEIWGWERVWGGYHFDLLLGSRRGDYLSTYRPSIHIDLKTNFASMHQLSHNLQEKLDTKEVKPNINIFTFP